MEREDAIVAAIRREARPLAELDAVDAIVDWLDGAETVLLGEATHGTHEFYRLRALLSRRLVEDHGFDAIAVEADWPDALRLHRWASGRSPAHEVDEAFEGFRRFPRWMWRNREMRDVAAWLRRHNDEADASRRVGFFGLDLYSLQASMHAVVEHLRRSDPAAARAAQKRYACFDGLAADPQRYGLAAHFDLGADCERAVLEQLDATFAATAADDPDEAFYARQNARVVAHAEAYYRTMFDAGSASWNLRDEHMAETLAALREHLAERRGRPARVVVWAHNSHVGDARATEFARHGQIDLGQRVRERPEAFGRCRLVGLTTHRGRVAAASDWDRPVEIKAVRPSLPHSVERLMHAIGLERFWLTLDGEAAAKLETPRLERAIGVVYRPETERASHYFEASVARQFDAVIHVDETRAVQPLDAPSRPPQRVTAETWPTGL